MRCDEESNQRGCNIERRDQAYTNRSNNNGNTGENCDKSYTNVSKQSEFTTANIIEGI